MSRADCFLASLLLLVALAPLLELVQHGGLMLSTLLCVVLILGILAMESVTSRRRFLLVLASITVVLETAGALGGGPTLIRIADALSFLLLAIAAIARLHGIATAPVVNRDVILNAISTYLLLGLIWALVFLLIHQADPTAFDFAPAYTDRNLTQYLYLSFMTLTTLGYGDVTSSNGFVKIWAVFESMIGVFFQAIVIARLVGVYRAVK